MGNNEVKTDRQSQVVMEVAELDNSIEGLTGSVESLESRLSNIVRNPEPPPDDDRKEEELVPLAHQIKVLRGRIVDINGKLISLKNRLEN